MPSKELVTTFRRNMLLFNFILEALFKNYLNRENKKSSKILRDVGNYFQTDAT